MGFVERMIKITLSIYLIISQVVSLSLIWIKASQRK